ncbi:PREDICTED: uncharacterized protein LOC106742680 [Dinoponera quadriceps]|uniref:Uncharacterized protein LOC106742680 n=1 Tax=Dinoponera quadriceps TaxID=609295 RepID=A0A6P3WZ46_DINQU|nr:PREDICTED: uncharacterized protein LOC106742680 [Dinoponera quadriceps]
MRTCVVCKKFSIPGDNSRSFHKFPDDCVLRDKWMLALGISSVATSTTVCSDHFDENAYHKTDGYTTLKRLLHDAIPISQSSVECDKLSDCAQTSAYTGTSESSVSMPADDDLTKIASIPTDDISNITASIPTDSAVFNEPTSVTNDDFENESHTRVSDKIAHSNKSLLAADVDDSYENRKR